MKIIHERPPNFEAIKTVFPHADGPNVIFAYAPDIYVPSGGEISVALIAHEKTHIDQQCIYGGVDLWWERYLVDPNFRLDQEVEAHREEYASYARYVKDRNLRDKYKTLVCMKLASQLYGSMLTVAEARRRLK